MPKLFKWEPSTWVSFPSNPTQLKRQSTAKDISIEIHSHGYPQKKIAWNLNDWWWQSIQEWLIVEKQKPWWDPGKIIQWAESSTMQQYTSWHTLGCCLGNADSRSSPLTRHKQKIILIGSHQPSKLELRHGKPQKEHVYGQIKSPYTIKRSDWQLFELKSIQEAATDGIIKWLGQWEQVYEIPIYACPRKSCHSFPSIAPNRLPPIKYTRLEEKVYPSRTFSILKLTHWTNSEKSKGFVDELKKKKKKSPHCFSHGTMNQNMVHRFLLHPTQETSICQVPTSIL